jgi:hypothetical protein
MTQDEIDMMWQKAMRQAIEAGEMFTRHRFAKLVAQHEREACAKVCDVLAVHPEYASDITKLAAKAIKARGQA